MSTKTESTEEIKKDNSGQSSLMDWIGSFGAEDIGVDIGTSNIVPVSYTHLTLPTT